MNPCFHLLLIMNDYMCPMYSLIAQEDSWKTVPLSQPPPKYSNALLLCLNNVAVDLIFESSAHESHSVSA